VTPEDLADGVDRDGLERPAEAGRRGRPDKGVVDGRLGRLEGGLEEGPDGIGSEDAMRDGASLARAGPYLGQGRWVEESPLPRGILGLARRIRFHSQAFYCTSVNVNS